MNTFPETRRLADDDIWTLGSGKLSLGMKDYTKYFYVGFSKLSHQIELSFGEERAY